MLQATQLVGVVPADVLASKAPRGPAETAFAELLNALAVSTEGTSLSLNSAHPNSPPAHGDDDSNPSEESATESTQLVAPVCLPVPVAPVPAGMTPPQSAGPDSDRSELPATLPNQTAPVLGERESSSDIASAVSNLPNESDSQPPDIHPMLPDLAPTTDTTKTAFRPGPFPVNEKFPSGECHRDEVSDPQQTVMQPAKSSVVRAPEIMDEKVFKIPHATDLMRVMKPKEPPASKPVGVSTSDVSAVIGSSPELKTQTPASEGSPTVSCSSIPNTADFGLAAPKGENRGADPKSSEVSQPKASTKAPEPAEDVKLQPSGNEPGFPPPQSIVLEPKPQLNPSHLASHNPAFPTEINTPARTPELPEPHRATGKTPEWTVDVPVTPGAVHLLTRVERQEMRFGWNTPDFGRIEVHTTLERDRVGATVAVPDLRMRESLQAESALLGRALADRALELGNFQTLDSGSHSQGHDANPNQQSVAPRWHLPRSGSAVPYHAKLRSTYHIGSLDLRA